MDPTLSFIGFVLMVAAFAGLYLSCKETTYMASPEALAALKASFDKVVAAVQVQTAEVAALRAELVDAKAHMDDAAVMEVASGLDAIATQLSTTGTTETAATTDAAAA